jgi:hypothetical protein
LCGREACRPGMMGTRGCLPTRAVGLVLLLGWGWPVVAFLTLAEAVGGAGLFVAAQLVGIHAVFPLVAAAEHICKRHEWVNAGKCTAGVRLQFQVRVCRVAGFTLQQLQQVMRYFSRSPPPPKHTHTLAPASSHAQPLSLNNLP